MHHLRPLPAGCIPPELSCSCFLAPVCRPGGWYVKEGQQAPWIFVGTAIVHGELSALSCTHPLHPGPQPGRIFYPRGVGWSIQNGLFNVRNKFFFSLGLLVELIDILKEDNYAALESSGGVLLRQSFAWMRRHRPDDPVPDFDTTVKRFVDALFAYESLAATDRDSEEHACLHAGCGNFPSVLIADACVSSCISLQRESASALLDWGSLPTLCTVCGDRAGSNGGQVRTLRCEHSFCSGCTSEGDTCPCCKPGTVGALLTAGAVSELSDPPCPLWSRERFDRHINYNNIYKSIAGTYAPDARIPVHAIPPLIYGPFAGHLRNTEFMTAGWREIRNQIDDGLWGDEGLRANKPTTSQLRPFSALLNSGEINIARLRLTSGPDVVPETTLRGWIDTIGGKGTAKRLKSAVGCRAWLLILLDSLLRGESQCASKTRTAARHSATHKKSGWKQCPLSHRLSVRQLPQALQCVGGCKRRGSKVCVSASQDGWVEAPLLQGDVQGGR